jgi:hypothetical protein
MLTLARALRGNPVYPKGYAKYIDLLSCEVCIKNSLWDVSVHCDDQYMQGGVGVVVHSKLMATIAFLLSNMFSIYIDLLEETTCSKRPPRNIPTHFDMGTGMY